jgi:tetratricopeptide (TPR) repeat protein
VSQSPLDSQNLTGLQSYRQGWKALNRLLHENKSFSGRETNNAFLNCGDGGPFADVSTVIGWDFADDARAIGLIDYDQDGDLDLFVTNRTAPRVRLLQNNLKSDSSFFALHLTGTAKTTPRDAIGARVAVHLKGQPIPHLRTLHAGQSFLSQSSRWLHFGLGKDATLEKIIVSWPGAKPQTFTNIQPNQFLHLTQGSDKATLRQKKTVQSLTSSDQEPAPPTALARIIPPAGNAVPELPTAEGKTLSFKTTTLISLWSRTCPHCREELAAWAKDNPKWETSGIHLILFATDQEPRAQCDAFLKSIKANFSAEMASPQAVEMLDALQASILDLWTPLPVPSSFLVSAEGELLAIYRGSVTTDQVISDAQLATASPVKRRAAGSPFTGRWVGDPILSSPQRTTQQLVQRAFPDLAIDYLSAALSKPSSKADKFTQADNYLLLGQLLGQEARPAEALKPLRKAREFLPNDIRILRLLAAGLSETANDQEAFAVLDDAISRHPKNPDLYQDGERIALKTNTPARVLAYLEKAVALQPTLPQLRYRLILRQLEQGQPAQAIAHCKTILGTSPKFLDAANLLARILATHPNEKIRAAEEALALASRLCQISKNRDGKHLLTLAYAQANLGKFPAATATLNLLTKAAPPDSPFTKEVKAALQKTNASQPIRNPTWK